ncbi:MAG: aromatic acid decarboxylase [Actinobacteria bacterium HGW-Actinobacteria-6]|nr:MAG: aromatic acid decarboxylase [Actinobacteria bacterium HGW-Actinobacteria-6]
MKHYVVVITGASGSVYGLRAVEQLLTSGHTVSLVATPTGAEVMAYETGLRLPETSAKETVLRFLDLPPDAPLRVVPDNDMFDAVASGSSSVDGVIVVPASMGFVASVAAGLGSDLAERAADVALKERRPLVLVPRETPLNLIHLRNMTSLAEAGAIIVPAMPAFYQRPETLDDMVNFVVGKALDVLGVEHELYPRWRE